MTVKYENEKRTYTCDRCLKIIEDKFWFAVGRKGNVMHFCSAFCRSFFSKK